MQISCIATLTGKNDSDRKENGACEKDETSTTGEKNNFYIMYSDLKKKTLKYFWKGSES